MGQGTWGMFDDKFDHIGEHIDSVRPDKMSKQHLRNKVKWAERKASTANCTYDEEQWSELADSLRDELYVRISSDKSKKIDKKTPKKKQPTRGAKLTMKCHCGNEYKARKADVNRGWGLSCSKSCAAVRRDFKRPAATIIK